MLQALAMPSVIVTTSGQAPATQSWTVTTMRIGIRHTVDDPGPSVTATTKNGHADGAPIRIAAMVMKAGDPATALRGEVDMRTTIGQGDRREEPASIQPCTSVAGF
jgi:hypothetical protein